MLGYSPRCSEPLCSAITPRGVPFVPLLVDAYWMSLIALISTGLSGTTITASRVRETTQTSGFISN